MTGNSHRNRARTLIETWHMARRVRLGDVARVVRYRFRWAWYQAHYEMLPGTPARPRSFLKTVHRYPGHLFRARPVVPPQPPTDAVVAATVLPQGLAVQSTQGCLTVEVVDGHTVRLRAVRQAPMPSYFSYATILEPQPGTAVVTVDGPDLQVETETLKVAVQRQPLRIAITTAAGEPLLEGVNLVWDERSGWLRCQVSAATQFYGMGERAAPLALAGRRFQLTTLDPESYRPGDDPLYMNIPFLVVLDKGRAFGLLFDSTHNAELDLGQAQPGELCYRTRGLEVRVDLVLGPSLAEVVERYTGLTGRMPLPPLWTLGYHQSRWSYETAARVAEIAQEFRTRQLPCEAIHLDIDYMDGFRCFTWNPETFPDPDGLVAGLHRQNFKAVAMIDPGIKVDPAYAVCADGLVKDMFIKLPDGSPVHGPVWPGECYFPDFTNPAVRHWWGDLFQGLVETGVDGFWNDMNEPAVFGKATLPDAAQYSLEGRGGDHRQGQSAYGMQMVRATYEGLNRLRPGMRNWVFTRSGYAGVQRYGSGWTADNTSEWEHLRITPAMLLNLGLSGLAFTGCDVGGFAGEPTPELFARWISMAAFTPFYRTHTAKHTAPQEPWSFGPEVEAIARTYLGWRYRLLPYLYTAFWQCSQTGVPIMRPLVLADASTSALQQADDQWLLGDHLLVSPVLEAGVAARTLLLPQMRQAGGSQEGWYDFWTDERLAGVSSITRAAPLDLVPLHVTAGAVLPLGPVRQHTGDRPEALLELHVFPGEGCSWLYEDDGKSLDYRQGNFRLNRFDMQQSGDYLEIIRTVEGRYLPTYRQLAICLHGGAVASAKIDGRKLDLETAMVMLPAGGWRHLQIYVTVSPI